MTWSKLALTAAASNGVPSWNVTPSFRWKVYCSPSLETSHDSASHGLNDPSGSWTTSESNVLRSTNAAISAAVAWRLNWPPGSESMATVMVPPSTAAADGAPPAAEGLAAAEPVAELLGPLVAAVAEAPAGVGEDGLTAAGVHAARTMTMTTATAMRSRERPLDGVLLVSWMALRV